jgi:hypothetical protein
VPLQPGPDLGMLVGGIVLLCHMTGQDVDSLGFSRSMR